MAALWLIYSEGSPFDNATGRNAVLVEAADESAARALAVANAPDGETKVPAALRAIQLGASAHADFGTAAPSGVVWLQGRGVVEPVRRSSGG